MLNECNFIGNLGRDPEIRYTNDGKKIANLSLGCTEKWTQNGERKERTEWVRIVVFNDKLADICEQYLRKGSKIFVKGQMQTRKWQGQDGQDKYSTEIVLSGFNGTIKMLDGRSSNDGAQQRQESQAQDGPDLDDDLPF